MSIVFSQKAPALGLGTAIDMLNFGKSAVVKGFSYLENCYGGSSYETGDKYTGVVAVVVDFVLLLLLLLIH